MVLLLALIATPFIFKNKILNRLKREVNSQLNAKVDFSNDISLTVFKDFPNISVGLKNVSVVGKDTFAGDTLLQAKTISLSLDIMSVIKGDKMMIEGIYLDHPGVVLKVLKDGRANWDITKVDTTKPAAATDTASSFKLALKKLTIEHGNLVYDDRSMLFYTSLKDFSHELKGDFTQDNFLMQTKTSSPDFRLVYDGVPYIAGVNSIIDADLQMDMKNSKYGFENVKAKLNDLVVIAKGFVKMNENDMDMDISFNAEQNTFKSFLSMIPVVYSSSFKDIKADGMMAFNGKMKGKMTDELLPAFTINLNIDNGTLQYPSLPMALSDLDIKLSYSNPNGNPDLSVVDVSKFHMVAAGEPFDANLLLKTPVSDPYMKGKMKGKIDLEKFAAFIPLDKGTVLKGIIDADVSADGHYSAIESKSFSNFNALGKVIIKNLAYKDGLPMDQLDINSAELNFTPREVNMPVCKGNVGKSDFDATGTLSNFFGYMFSGQVLKGSMFLNSNYINVNQFMSDAPENSAPTVADTVQLQVVQLPINMDIAANVDVKKMIYDNYIIENLVGSMVMRDGKMNLSGVSADMLGGNIKFDGIYDPSNPKSPFTDLNVNLNRFDIPVATQYFTTLQKFAPIMKYMKGMFNAGVTMHSHLKPDMGLEYPTMNMDGFVSIGDASVSGFKVLDKIATALKVDAFKNLQLKNQTFKFKIRDGIFNLLDSFNIPMGQGAMMKLAGATRLDQTLDYGGWIKIPRKLLGEGNELLNAWTAKIGSKAGAKINVNEMIPVDLKIGGTITNPKVSISLKGAKKALVDDLVDQGKEIGKEKANEAIGKGLEEARKRADAIIAKAHESAEKIRAEGKSAADAVRNEANKSAQIIRDNGEKLAQATIDEGDKRANEVLAKAKNPLEKVGAEKAAKEIRKQASAKATTIRQEANNSAQKVQDTGENKAKGIENEANSKATKMEDEAKEQANRIMKEAEEKSKIK